MFALVVVLAAIGLSFWRYRRFVGYRVLDAILGYSIDREVAAQSGNS